MPYYQQGDVLIRKIDSLPEGLVEQNARVLQSSPTSSHKHQFLSDKVVVLVDPTYTPSENAQGTNVGRFIHVLEQSDLTHEEHKPIPVAPGFYEIDLVREEDYETKQARYVVD